jgi:hypothetical protein
LWGALSRRRRAPPSRVSLSRVTACRSKSTAKNGPGRRGERGGCATGPSSSSAGRGARPRAVAARFCGRRSLLDAAVEKRETWLGASEREAPIGPIADGLGAEQKVSDAFWWGSGAGREGGGVEGGLIPRAPAVAAAPRRCARSPLRSPRPPPPPPLSHQSSSSSSPSAAPPAPPSPSPPPAPPPTYLHPCLSS